MQQKRPQIQTRVREKMWNKKMQITDIKSVSKTKFKVYLDGQFAFLHFIKANCSGL